MTFMVNERWGVTIFKYLNYQCGGISELLTQATYQILKMQINKYLINVVG